MVKVNKPFWKSKTKLAGILAALGLALPGVIEWLNTGNIGSGLNGIYMAVIAVLGVFGVRDALNK